MNPCDNGIGRMVLGANSVGTRRRTASTGRLQSQGHVTVGTDIGHTGDDPDVFVQGAANPEIITDWGHGAVHESVVNAKRVTKAFTGAKPRYSYFVGCATGASVAGRCGRLRAR